MAVFEDEYGVRHEYYRAKNAGDSRFPHKQVVYGTSFSPDLAVDRFMVMVPNHRELIRMNIDCFSSCDNTRLNAMKAVSELLRLFIIV